MDKTEYQEKLNELQGYLHIKDYDAAYKLVNGIDWRRVKSIRTLNMVADVYEVNKDYERCRQILNIALGRSSIGKGILYRLVEVCIKDRDINSAQDYYKRYIKLAPRDNGRLLLEYKLAKAMKRPIDDQISILEQYREREYTERWAYELALLYSRAGLPTKCVEACDDLILWFSEGKYVLKAMKLKMRYESLSATQQNYYDKEQKYPDSSFLYTSGYLGSGNSSSGKKSTFIDRMDEAGAALTKGVSADTTGMMPLTNEEMDNVSVTSPQFIGGSPDIKAQLEKSIKDIGAGVHDAPKVENKPFKTADFDFEEFLKASEAESSKNTAASAKEDAEKREVSSAMDVEPKEEPANDGNIFYGAEKFSYEESVTDSGHEKKNDVLSGLVSGGFSFGSETEDSESFAFEAPATAEAPKAVLDDREIPDPEPSADEMKTRTIPLNTLGLNTVPLPIEEILASETPEERRIRILNNAVPSKMNDLQRHIFTYFARVPGMDIQILKAMSSVYTHAGEHTSKSGNIAVMGAPGAGKSRLTEGLITAMCKDMELDVAKTARLNGEKMNYLDPAKVVDRMSGGFLVIENASDMAPKTIDSLSRAMEFKTDCMILILEDEKTAMRSLLAKYPEFGMKFTGIISIPVFTNDELVSFARTYCSENNCQMDELGVLALYSLISNGQSEDQPMTISSVKSIMDTAISKAKRTGRRGRRLNSKNKIMTLYEKDFS